MTPLESIIRRRIAAEGPIAVSEYMALCLGHPEHGYYRNRDPLGRGGDFITAPEVSQMFGELIGLWLAQVWSDQGSPDPFILVEFGPGRGTLMADALRAARLAPGFAEAAQLWLVETSPVLREAQWRALSGHKPRWADTLEDLPEGPLFIIANEFFDALPIRQFQSVAGGWRERVIGLEEDALAFGLAPPTDVNTAPETAREGAIHETCPAGRAIAQTLGARISRSGGAALIIDYGYDLAAPLGDTLQAMRGHAYADPLKAPGEADLTAHVDFRALAREARMGGAAASGAVSQAELLEALGIRLRAAMLAKKHPDQAEAVTTALQRLTGADQMGALFQALALTPEGAATPPGFEDEP